MERVILDILHEVGIEKPHPEDVRRIQDKYFGGPRWSVARGVFRALWPSLFGAYLKAKETRTRGEMYTKARSQ